MSEYAHTEASEGSEPQLLPPELLKLYTMNQSEPLSSSSHMYDEVLYHERVARKLKLPSLCVLNAVELTV